MTERQNISSGTSWEAIAGFSRAVRIGNVVHVSGTTATDENGNVVGLNDPYAQTGYIIRKIERALNEAGAALSNVIRTRIYVTDVKQWEVVARAHGEFFKDIRAVAAMIEVKGFISPEMLVEIEADAVLTD